MKKKKHELKDMSDVLKSLSLGLKEDYSKNTVDWITSNKMKTEDGILMDFTKRRFLIDFMNDESPKQAILASAQLGKTVGMYFKAMYMNFRGLNVMLSEPTGDLRDLLTKSKLNRLVEQNELLKSNVSGDLNVKYVRDRMLYLTYTFGSAPVGYSTDLNIYDEVSRSNTETIQQWTGRLLNSKYKYEWLISNPAMPNDLLHNMFLESDQKHWAIKPSCGCKRQILNYDGMYGYKGNVCKEREQLVCQYCGKILDPNDVINGEWVKRYPTRHISGYWMSQLLRPMDSVQEQQMLVRELIYEEKKNKMSFMNMFLGLPYSGSETSVNGQIIRENLIAPVKHKEYVTMGIDVGGASGHYYVVGSGNTIFAMGIASDWGEVRQVIKQYGVQQITVDQNPEYSAAKELQAEYPNLCFRANYVGNKTQELISYNEETGLVNINRNVYFDHIIEAINRGEYKFAFRDGEPMLKEFIKQFSSLSKIPKFDAQGNPTFKWEAPNEGVADHFAHAFLYWTVSNYRLEQIMPKHGIIRSKQEYERNKIISRTEEAFDVNPNEQPDWYNL